MIDGVATIDEVVEREFPGAKIKFFNSKHSKDDVGLKLGMFDFISPLA